MAASGSRAELSGQVNCRHVARVQPAVGRRFAISRVDPQHEFSRILAARFVKPLRLDQRGRADHQPAQTEIQQLANRLLIANPAAQLALDVDLRQDFLDAREIYGQSLAGPFQIDDVQMPGAGIGELSGDSRRVLRKDRFLLVVALSQPDALPTAKVYRWPDLHRNSFRLRPRYAGNSRSGETQNMPHVMWRGKGRAAYAARASGSADRGSGRSERTEARSCDPAAASSLQLPSSAKFFNSRKPAAWLFSGWNCTANKLSRQMLEQKGDEYSVSVATTDVSRGTT